MKNKDDIMSSELEPIQIQNKILIIRNQQVMIDRDLAEMYGVETKVLNQAVKRNIARFPERFHFQLTENEFEILRSQFVTSKTETRGGRQYLPYAFTEQGCAMLSAVLKSETAVQVSINIKEEKCKRNNLYRSKNKTYSSRHTKV